MAVEFLPSRIEASDGVVVEYLVRRNDDRPDAIRLFAMRTRSDKKHANGDTVVHRTIRDFFDHVDIEDIAAFRRLHGLRPGPVVPACRDAAYALPDGLARFA